MFDIGMIKINCIFFGALLIVKILPVLHPVEWYWYLLLR
jgi:hypothetical protein